MPSRIISSPITLTSLLIFITLACLSCSLSPAPSIGIVTPTQLVSVPELPSPSPTPIPTIEPTPTPTLTSTPSPISTSISTFTPTPVLTSPTTALQTIDTTNLSIVPSNKAALVDWLASAWEQEADLEQVVTVLEQGQWTSKAKVGYWDPRDSRKVYDRWSAVDIDGDGREEWILTIFDLPASCGNPEYQKHGELWIINQNGLIVQIASKEEFAITSLAAPLIVQKADLTGDGLPDLVIESIICGAHTNTGIYHVISGHGGQIQNIIKRDNDLYRASYLLRNQRFLISEEEWYQAGIPIISPSPATIIQTKKLPLLYLEGGWFASVGAGPHRAFAETWSWNGSALTLSNIQSSEAFARVHILYDANFAFVLGDIPKAIEAYKQVIEDQELSDKGVMLEPMETYDDARKFAAFRLALSNLQEGNLTEAIHWRDWLHLNYPESALTEGADLLLATWQETSSLSQACARVINRLHRRATGALIDTGYANPSLTNKEVCPVE